MYNFIKWHFTEGLGLSLQVKKNEVNKKIKNVAIISSRPKKNFFKNLFKKENVITTSYLAK